MSSKARILLIHETLGFQGGAEQYLANYLPHLRKDYSIHLLHARHSGTREQEFSQLFDSCDHLDWRKSDKGVREHVRQVLNLRGPDLIFFHKCLSVPVLEEVLASEIRSMRMVHDHDVYCMRTYKYYPWSRTICGHKADLRCIFPCMAVLKRDQNQGRFGFSWMSYRKQQKLIRLDQQLDRFLTLTPYMRDELLRQGYAANKIFLHPPVPPPISGVTTSTFSDENILLFTGQIVRGKGLDSLIEALGEVSVEFQLQVFGDGSHRYYCEELSNKLGIADRIHFHGFRPQAELWDVYKKASICVVPSLWPEPFGMVGPEASTWGLPVIAFDVGGISDWLKHGETGYLIPPKDITSLGQRITGLLSDKNKAKTMGQAGKAFISKKFDFETNLKLLRKYIDDI